MGSDWLEELRSMLARALADGPDHYTLELSTERFPEIGEALDTASAVLEARGYRLTKVIAEGPTWTASYERSRPAD